MSQQQSNSCFLRKHLYPWDLLVGSVLTVFLLIGCGSSSNNSPDARMTTLPDVPVCMPRATHETMCSDGVDDDCDGYPDCLDTECEQQSCGAGNGLTCTAGACLRPCDPDAGTCLPALPSLENVHTSVNNDTATIEFEPLANARDYRVYVMPNPSDILVGANGEVGVRNAIYRCSGDRPRLRREDDQVQTFGASLNVNVRNYMRAESQALLGYVFLTPGMGRVAVYRMADPNLVGGYAWEWGAPPGAEFNGADYVVGTQERDRLLARGFRDDGIAFYIPENGTKPIYRRQYNSPQGYTDQTVIFYTDGPEATARASEDASDYSDSGMRFRVLAETTTGAVPLYRVFYSWGHGHDVLAAGEARYQWVLHQGNQALPSVSWPGITGPTTLVVEALDNGCPFPGGYIGYAHHNAAGDHDQPTITLQEGRLSSGEVYINGQHDPNNRPRPIARSFVQVTPQARDHFDWFEGFDVGAQWTPPPLIASTHNGTYVYRNERFSAEFAGCTENHSFGPLLGQLMVGGGDWGSSCNIHVAPRGVDTRLAADRFLHVRMSTDIPSTFRRYPQLMITTAQLIDPAPNQSDDEVPVGSRLGPLDSNTGTEATIVVQPFGTAHELQIEFCDRRGWGVNSQCPRANIYGFHAGDYQAEWEEPWLPVVALGDRAGWDRPVRFDVYASTRRVYVFIDGQPGGCAILPVGRMPANPVTVLFSHVGYHMDIDEGVVPDDSPHQYLRTRSLNHIDRHMDDWGVELNVAEPGWDETRLPCGTRWYGGG